MPLDLQMKNDDEDGQCVSRVFVHNQASLYEPSFEHDACGVGFIANIKGEKSHDTVSDGIRILDNLSHRGASGGDGLTGDGAGILVHIPHVFFAEVFRLKGVELPPAGAYGVASIFMPSCKKFRRQCQDVVEKVVAEKGMGFLGWREVPVNPDMLGETARSVMPFICQGFVTSKLARADFERRLYLARRVIEKRIGTDISDDFYIASMSCSVIVYKGMLKGGQLSNFYPDLCNENFISAIAVVHERYSTNTFPSWKLAQPFRYLAHNGEINTLRGNKRQMSSRERMLASDLFGTEMSELLPVIDDCGSDSACLDNILELLVSCGRDIAHSVMMLMPQAWGPKYPIGPDQRGFFEYNAGLMEPWDGPAALVFTDGCTVGACLDRNGLRPARYTVTADGRIILASEAGVLNIDSSNVIEKGSLRPGQMIIVDTLKGRVVKDGEIKAVYTRKQPYRRWVEENRISLHGLFNDVAPVQPETGKLLYRQRLFGYTREDIGAILSPMASSGHEPVGSMGFDAPLAILSEKPQLLYDYFRQLFAQVTNPPIDPIREELVMSLMTFMGNQANILSDEPDNAKLIKLIHPILSNEDMERLKSINTRGFSSVLMSIGFPVSGGSKQLGLTLEELCSKALDAAVYNRKLIVLSDKNLSEHEAAIPALLAVSAVNQRLAEAGRRTGTSIILETGEARETHHYAALLGYGATAVNPYLAFDTIADLAVRKALESDIDVTTALENYIKALCGGLLKIMSKMGISTLRSYRSAQVFEAIGLGREMIGKYFRGTPSRIGGIGLAEIAEEAIARYNDAGEQMRKGNVVLKSGGHYRFRKDGERHLWTPESITTLQQATRRNDMGLYRKYARMINDQAERQYTLRGLFKFKDTKPVPIDEVEPAENIIRRFVTSAMSFGSISKEAHETLAEAMNNIGGMSNSGEGGEDPERYKPLSDGRNLCSAIKQVASGRFGVTIDYLVSARELQIKMAQGAKPGEGGQLPGHKVNKDIALVRYSTPGVTLISPPPHHDIYSIEDIKQLIFDLKNANPTARVSVKLVSEAGVGTVAAGVAKGNADLVLISGGDGGTGASPLSSIRHAGVPWELGLAETQQTLTCNNLRSRIILQVDGQIKTGRDVVIACLLGADEFGFATAPLVVCGCVMMRNCHKNTCSVGIATQDPELRKRFTGKPEYVINFFSMLAQEVRELLAQLGFRKMEDMIGRSDLLDFNNAIGFWKIRELDFSGIFACTRGQNLPTESIVAQNGNRKKVLDNSMITMAREALKNGKRVEMDLSIRNIDRATGTMLSGEIARRYGGKGLPDNTIVCRFRGAAGQSFGAFAAKGLTMELEGEANDYLGKGLSGGKLIVKPDRNAKYDPSENIICGNVLLYGATSGEAYIHGRVGERFAVRNSGCMAVVEGVGDHGCEYMTGGRVVIIGETGVNFAAGMSGGIAYVLDEKRYFENNCNLDMVDLELVDDTQDEEELLGMLNKHAFHTGSKKAKAIIENWEESKRMFVKVFPIEYRRVLGKMIRADADVERQEVING